MDATVTHVNQFGFYARVGPLQVFITRYAMPEDMTTYEMETQMWISDDKEVEIKAGSGEWASGGKEREKRGEKGQ